MTLTPSPFAVPFPDMPPVAGVQLAVAASNTRYKERDDLLLVTMPQGTQVAGVFTQNSLPGEPIIWNKQILPHAQAQALLVNAGIANVMNGADGVADQAQLIEALATQQAIPAEQIYIGSTGIIGERLDAQGLVAQFPALQRALTPHVWHQAAAAIATTDTFPKGACRTATIGAQQVQINGITKGSGMIEPNMATMLAYIWTDATLPASLLQELLDTQVQSSFNAITVDSDTSTSDMVLLFATQQREHWPIEAADAYEFTDFREKLQEVMQELAMQVVKDGEGLSKLLTVNVAGAADDAQAMLVAKSIANSPLVKTAIAGEDPNWGRIVMAIGKTGLAVDPNQLSLAVGEVMVLHQGQPHPHYSEADAASVMQQGEISLHVSLGVGSGSAICYGNDLTHEYIRINADYRS